MNALKAHNAWQRIGWYYDAAEERRKALRSARMSLIFDKDADKAKEAIKVLEVLEDAAKERCKQLKRAADRLGQRLARMEDPKPHIMWALRLGGMLQELVAAYKANYEETYTNREAAESVGRKWLRALVKAEDTLDEYAKGEPKGD